MRKRALHPFAFCLIGLACGVRAEEATPGATPRSACGVVEDVRGVIESVTAHGEIKLASGKLVKLSGVRLADGETAARAWLAAHVGKPAEVRILAREDRWGRAAARVVLTGASGGFDLAHGLVEEGLALVDAGEADRLCQPELLALETTARDRGLGLWAGGRYKPVPADHEEELRERIGRFALLEGRIRSVGERRQRTYLNLDAGEGRSVSVTIPKRTWGIMVDKGFSATGLRGRRIRARGVVEEWRGLVIEVTVADMVEILDQGRGRR